MLHGCKKYTKEISRLTLPLDLETLVRYRTRCRLPLHDYPHRPPSPHVLCSLVQHARNRASQVIRSNPSSVISSRTINRFSPNSSSME